MGLFNDYLDATLRKAKSTEADSTKPTAPTAPVMAETPDLMTLNGNPPNGAVPPGRMLVKRPNPPSEPPEREQPVIIVPFVQQREVQDDKAAVVPVVIHQWSNLQSRSSITPARTQRVTQSWSHSTPGEVSTKVENYIHYDGGQHIHYHQTTGPANANNHQNTGPANANNHQNTSPANANNNALTRSLSPIRQTHTWIKCVTNNPSPARSHPDPCLRFIQVESLPCRVIPKNTTMREFLLKALPVLGLSCERGNGVQQIFPMGNNVWAPGQIFKWGDGEADAVLGETELSKGYPDHEMFIARWTGW